MALDSTATQLPTVGHVLTGTVGATRPTLTQLTTFATGIGTLPTGFTELGHTDRDDVFAFGQDDGDTEIKGSWQSPTLREIVTSVAVDYFVIKTMQLDNANLALYYGGGDIITANEFALPASAANAEKAVAVVMVDGTTVTTFYVPRCSIRREDAPEFAVDDLTKFPLRFTVLSPTSGAKAFWIADNLGA